VRRQVELSKGGGESVDYCDSEYRRQCCRERIERIRDDYRRAQAPPPNDVQRRRRVVGEIRAIRERIRGEAEQRAPA
jgi:hypothetical protein